MGVATFFAGAIGAAALEKSQNAGDANWAVISLSKEAFKRRCH